MLASLNVHDIVTFDGVEILDPLWSAGVKSVTKAELPPVVQAPSEHLMLVIDVEGVLVSTENIHSIFGANFLDFESLLILVSRVEHSTDLAGLGIAPSKDFSAGGQSQSMVRSACNLFQLGL